MVWWFDPSCFSPLLGHSMEMIFPVFLKVLSTTWYPCPICKYFCLGSSVWLRVSDLYNSTCYYKLKVVQLAWFSCSLSICCCGCSWCICSKEIKKCWNLLLLVTKIFFFRKTKWANVTVFSSVDSMFKAFFQHCLCEMQSVLWSESETGNLPQRANIKQMWILCLISVICFAYWNAVSIWTPWWITTSDIYLIIWKLVILQH